MRSLVASIMIVLAASCDSGSHAPDAAVREDAASRDAVTWEDASPIAWEDGNVSRDAREPDVDAAPGAIDAAAPDAGPTIADAGPPAALTRWIAGPATNATVVSPGPALILMGGGRDVDAAYAWASRRLPGGDAVVVRASGADGYQDYLFTEIGGFDSVETLLVDERALAEDAWVADRVREAELVYFAGGDQGRYVDLWRGTALEAAVREAWRRGATIGGTSAGEMILGSTIYSASRGSITSDEALANPRDPDVTLVPAMFELPPLASTVLDSHFAERDRFGRLAVFLAHGPAERAIGVDERTAVLVGPDGNAEVTGSGAVYVLSIDGPRPPLAAPLDGLRLSVIELRQGDTIALPAGTSPVAPRSVRVERGALVPANPY